MPEWDQLDKRLNALSIIAFVIVVVLMARLGYMQVIKGSTYARQAEINSTRVLPVEASRGEIYASDGALLATSRPGYYVSYLDTGTSDRNEVLTRLAEMVNLPAEDMIKAVESNRWRRYQPVRLTGEIPLDMVLILDEHRMDLPGVMVQTEPVRVYPQGTLAAHVLGGVGPLTDAQLKTISERGLAGYSGDETVGRLGVELAYEFVSPDRSLRGTSGGELVQVDANGRLVQQLGYTPPVPGNSLHLTLDSKLQRVAEAAIATQLAALQKKPASARAREAAVVAMDPRTGAVLAFASYPGFDPGTVIKDYAELLNNPDRPLENKVFTQYPPGSIFKPVTMLAGFRDGVVDASSRFNDPGYFTHPWLGDIKKKDWLPGGHGYGLTPSDGIKYSCNTVFYNIGTRIYGKHGNSSVLDVIAATAEEFGLGKQVPFADMEGYRQDAGVLPTTDNFIKNVSSNYPNRSKYPYLSEVLDVTIGQGINTYTPLQIADYVSTLANGGTRYAPYLVDKITGPDGKVVYQHTPEVLNTVDIPQEAMKIIRDGMYQVANAGDGTAWSQFHLAGRDALAKAGIIVAAKTGTAQVYGQPDDGWMMAFAPYDNPQIAVVAFVKYGAGGSTAAGPIARQVLEAYFNVSTQVTSDVTGPVVQP